MASRRRDLPSERKTKQKPFQCHGEPNLWHDVIGSQSAKEASRDDVNGNQSECAECLTTDIDEGEIQGTLEILS